MNCEVKKFIINKHLLLNDRNNTFLYYFNNIKIFMNVKNKDKLYSFWLKYKYGLTYNFRDLKSTYSSYSYTETIDLHKKLFYYYG